MKNVFTPASLKAIDTEIERLANQLGNINPVDSDYVKVVDNIKVLCEARGVKTERAISTDVVITAVTNIVGILLVLNYEKLGIITSKAITFVAKGKM